MASQLTATKNSTKFNLCQKFNNTTTTEKDFLFFPQVENLFVAIQSKEEIFMLYHHIHLFRAFIFPFFHFHFHLQLDASHISIQSF